MKHHLTDYVYTCDNDNCGWTGFQWEKSVVLWNDGIEYHFCPECGNNVFFYEERQYYVVDFGRSNMTPDYVLCFWAFNECGYTDDVRLAGKLPRRRIMEDFGRFNNFKFGEIVQVKAVPVEEIDLMDQALGRVKYDEDYHDLQTALAEDGYIDVHDQLQDIVSGKPKLHSDILKMWEMWEDKNGKVEF